MKTKPWAVLLALSLLVPAGAGAQPDGERSARKERKGRSERPFYPGHELRVGVGIHPVLNGDYYEFWSTARLDAWLADRERYSFGALRTTGALTVAYGYRFRRWLEAGATLSYARFWRDTYVRLTGASAGKLRDNYLAVTPYARFTWLDRRWVKLYSQTGIGIGAGFGHDDSFGRERTKLRDWYPTLQLTPIGVAVGRKVYGYADMSISNIGWFHLGIGYRFSYE